MRESDEEKFQPINIIPLYIFLTYSYHHHHHDDHNHPQFFLKTHRVIHSNLMTFNDEYYTSKTLCLYFFFCSFFGGNFMLACIIVMFFHQFDIIVNAEIVLNESEAG